MTLVVDKLKIEKWLEKVIPIFSGADLAIAYYAFSHGLPEAYASSLIIAVHNKRIELIQTGEEIREDALIAEAWEILWREEEWDRDYYEHEKLIEVARDYRIREGFETEQTDFRIS